MDGTEQTQSNADSAFFSTNEAALALHKGLTELGAIAGQRGRWTRDMPHHVEQDRDRAARKVRDAVRFLCSEEAW